MLYVAVIFTLLCSFVIPILSFFLFHKLYKGTGKAIIFGIMTFIASQIIIRLPLLQILASVWPTYVEWLKNPNFIYCLFLGTTAGLFEEGARYLVMKVLLRGNKTDVDGIAFGIGHGGIEAILFVGINMLYLLPSIFTGSAEVLQLVGTGDVLLAGVERVFTMIFHIAWSLMVMKSIQNKTLMWVLVAFLSHAILDTTVAYLSIKGINIYIIESIMAVLTILPIIYIWFTIKKDREENPDMFKRIEGENGNN